MKKIICVLALAGAVALGGCATSGGFGTPTGSTGPTVQDTGGGIGTPTGSTGTASTDPTVIKIQDTAAKICGFVPTASTVLGIIGTFTGVSSITSVVSNVATAICGAVTKKSARRGGPGPMVRGVPVQGTFIQ